MNSIIILDYLLSSNSGNMLYYDDRFCDNYFLKEVIMRGFQVCNLNPSLVGFFQYEDMGNGFGNGFGEGQGEGNSIGTGWLGIWEGSGSGSCGADKTSWGNEYISINVSSLSMEHPYGFSCTI